MFSRSRLKGDKIDPDELTAEQIEEVLVVIESEWKRAMDPITARELSAFTTALARLRKLGTDTR